MLPTKLPLQLLYDGATAALGADAAAGGTESLYRARAVGCDGETTRLELSPA
jgi:hypothetical protein